MSGPASDGVQRHDGESMVSVRASWTPPLRRHEDERVSRRVWIERASEVDEVCAIPGQIGAATAGCVSGWLP